MSGFLQTLPHVPFISADFVFYHFATINPNHDHGDMLGHMSPREHPKPEGDLGTPDTYYL